MVLPPLCVCLARQLSLPLPRHRQLDWDALLSPTPQEFMEAAMVSLSFVSQG